MKLITYALKARVTVVMMVVGMVFLGTIAALRLPQALFPPVTYPQMTIVTRFPGAGPAEIENLISRPIEEVVGQAPGVRRVESISRENQSLVSVFFDWAESIDFAALAVREKLDLIVDAFPDDVEKPVALKVDPFARPVLLLSLTPVESKKDTALQEVKQVADGFLRDHLEKVEGVAAVSVSGGLDREIQVLVDPARLKAFGATLRDVVNTLANSNVVYPAGSIKKGLYEYSIRTVSEFRSVDEIRYAVVKMHKERPQEAQPESPYEQRAETQRETLESVREKSARHSGTERLVLLKDVAEVRDTFHEKDSFSRFGADENVSVSIQKQALANTIGLSRRLKKALLNLEADLRNRNVRCEIVYDQAVFIQNSLRGVRAAALQGGLLAFLVLFAFLRSAYCALIVTLAIPVTIFGVCFLMLTQGISLNVMSLGGLALGVGMMVDNGVVVVENIVRLREEGMSAKEAVEHGTQEVAWPLFSNTLTAIVVFLPLVLLVPGVGGQLFRDLSWTVIFSQLLSWGVSLTFTPILAERIRVKRRTPEEETLRKGSLSARIEAFVLAMDRARRVRWAAAILAGALASFLLGLWLLGRLDREVLPQVDQGQFLVQVELPPGTSIEKTETVTRRLVDVISQDPDVATLAATGGSSAASAEAAQAAQTMSSSQAQILVDLKRKRRAGSQDILERLRSKIGALDLMGAKLEYQTQGGEFGFLAESGGAVSVEIKGYDFDVLKELVTTVSGVFRAFPEVHGIYHDLGEPADEWKVEVNREKAALYGLDVESIAETAKTALQGVTATQYKEQPYEYDVVVKVQESSRQRLENVGDMLLFSDKAEQPIALSEVAAIERSQSPVEIRRRDLERTVTVRAQAAKGVNRERLRKALLEKIKGLEVPQGYRVRAGREVAEQKAAIRGMVFSIFLAVAFVYMIMAAQFQSFVQPFVILFTVPLSIAGVAVALLLTGNSLNVVSLLGIVLLGGIVVNNGIVLIDYTNRLREQGSQPLAAALRASLIRTRPILMSAVTSMIGSIPLAMGIGEGTAIQSPMAIATIGGLFTSTLLSVVVIPIIYVLFSRRPA